MPCLGNAAISTSSVKYFHFTEYLKNPEIKFWFNSILLSFFHL